jgi:hypothetical protein
MVTHLIKKTTALCIAGIMASCAPSGKISVTNINDAGFSQPTASVYSLPQTVIDITVYAEEIEIIPGPYHPYADKYLDIPEATDKPEHIWNITRVEVKHHVETDPDFIFSIQGTYDTGLYPDIAALMRDGLILNPGKPADQVFYNTFPSDRKEVYFTDNSIKRNFEAEKDVEVSLVMPDTNYLKRPAGRNALKEKTLEQKAEEAANFLIKLKKRRFKLVSGQYDYMPQGTAMADALQELARLEEEYLALFIGKRIVKSHERTFHYTPVTGKTADRIVLYRFSENEGFLDARETRGKPMVAELNTGNKTKGFEQSRIPSKVIENVMFYRLPDQAYLKLIQGESVMSEAIIPLYQAGSLIAVKVNPKTLK